MATATSPAKISLAENRGFVWQIVTMSFGFLGIQFGLLCRMQYQPFFVPLALMWINCLLSGWWLHHRNDCSTAARPL
jgi:hypothetical protein